jgi:hypothetical protein
MSNLIAVSWDSRGPLQRVQSSKNKLDQDLATHALGGLFLQRFFWTRFSFILLIRSSMDALPSTRLNCER